MPDSPVSQLSGGNAQKVSIAKWLYSDAKVFLLDEPTAGIDIGAKADILVLIRKLAAAGKAIVVVSSEFEELLAVCHRILVMRDGKCVAERQVHETSEHELVLLAGGQTLSDAEPGPANGGERSEDARFSAAALSNAPDAIAEKKVDWRRLLSLREMGVYYALLGLVLILSVLTSYAGRPAYFSMHNLTNVFYQSSLTSIMAVGMTVILISGNFDLSVASVAGLSAAIFIGTANTFGFVAWRIGRRCSSRSRSASSTAQSCSSSASTLSS